MIGLGLGINRRRPVATGPRYPLAWVEGRVLDLRPDPATMYVDAEGTQPANVSDPVGRWEDQGGQGNHAVQGTQSAKPTLGQRADGSYYLDFDGVDDWLQVNGPTLAQPNTVFMRMAWDEKTNSYPYNGTNGGERHSLLGGGGGGSGRGIYAGNVTGDEGGFDGSWSSSLGVYDGSDSLHYAGRSLVSESDVGDYAFAVANIGCRSISKGFAKMKCSRFIVIDRRVTSAELEVIWDA